MRQGGRIHAVCMREVDNALREMGGNKTKASYILGISLRTLRKWVNKEPLLAEWIGRRKLEQDAKREAI